MNFWELDLGLAELEVWLCALNANSELASLVAGCGYGCRSYYSL